MCCVPAATSPPWISPHATSTAPRSSRSPAAPISRKWRSRAARLEAAASSPDMERRSAAAAILAIISSVAADPPSSVPLRFRPSGLALRRRFADCRDRRLRRERLLRGRRRSLPAVLLVLAAGRPHRLARRGDDPDRSSAGDRCCVAAGQPGDHRRLRRDACCPASSSGRVCRRSCGPSSPSRRC